jgi:mannan endo-1,4-beta-mannosidase
MKRVKKALSLLLAFCMLMSMLPGLAMAEESGKTVPSYSDMDGHWAREAVERWSGYEVLTGSGDGTFRPDTSITRGEMAKVIATALKYETVGENVF